MRLRRRSSGLPYWLRWGEELPRLMCGAIVMLITLSADPRIYIETGPELLLGA